MDKILVVFYFKFKTIFQSNDFKHKVDSWYNTVNQICHTETQLYIQSSKPGLISMKLHYFGEGQVWKSSLYKYCVDHIQFMLSF